MLHTLPCASCQRERLPSTTPSGEEVNKPGHHWLIVSWGQSRVHPPSKCFHASKAGESSSDRPNGPQRLEELLTPALEKARTSMGMLLGVQGRRIASRSCGNSNAIQALWPAEVTGLLTCASHVYLYRKSLHQA